MAWVGRAARRLDAGRKFQMLRVWSGDISFYPSGLSRPRWRSLAIVGCPAGKVRPGRIVVHGEVVD